MYIPDRCAHSQLNIADAPQSQHLDGCVFMVNTAHLPHAHIASQQVFVSLHKGFQVNAANLFFALNDEFNVAGKFTFTVQDGINGMQAGGKVALIIRNAARIQTSITQGRLKRR